MLHGLVSVEEKVWALQPIDEFYMDTDGRGLHGLQTNQHSRQKQAGQCWFVSYPVYLFAISGAMVP